jgi:hypothetical protein
MSTPYFYAFGKVVECEYFYYGLTQLSPHKRCTLNAQTTLTFNLNIRRDECP